MSAPETDGHEIPSSDLLKEGIHPTPPVTVEPVVEMSPWLVLEVRPSGERHLCGWSGREGRVSSPLQAFDADTRTATTRSGRLYRLAGAPGTDQDADWVWRGWCRVNRVESWTDVSAEYLG